MQEHDGDITVSRVAHTALDARQFVFTVIVHCNATRAVNRRPGDGERALRELAAAAVKIAQ